MKTRSAKAKGRGQQQLIRDLILQTFSHCTELKEADVVSTTMGETGMDIKLSTKAREMFPFAVESRKQEKVNIWQCIKDAERHAEKEGLKPLGVIGRNHQAPYAVIRLTDLLQLVYDAYYYRNPGINGT